LWFRMVLWFKSGRKPRLMRKTTESNKIDDELGIRGLIINELDIYLMLFLWSYKSLINYSRELLSGKIGFANIKNHCCRKFPRYLRYFPTSWYANSQNREWRETPLSFLFSFDLRIDLHIRCARKQTILQFYSC
jgi:hypothetical protein